MTVRAALAAGLMLAVLAAGCASDGPKPAALEPFDATMTAPAAWNARIDGADFPLSVAVSPGVFTVAASDGTVLSLAADNGRELWRTSVGARLGAGVGSDGRFAAVVTRDGELVVLEAGRTLWRQPLSLRVTTAPLVAGERVFVLGIDRSVHAFDALDGTRLWSVRRPGDPLTLSQAGVIAPLRDTLLAGQGPRLAGFDPSNGELRWEVAVGSPRGTNEVERLADLVAPMARAGDVTCVRSFQAAVGCVDAGRGTLMWTRPVGGTVGVAADEELVFGADASDRITAWKTRTGDVAWQSDKLLYRELGAPLATARAVVFGDSDGVVHFLSRATGATALRLTTDGSAVQAAPVVSGSTMLVVTRKGGLFAFRPQ
jgi:outer membrane assembly lipoprotein YfgL